MSETAYSYPVVLVNVSRSTNAISFPMGLSVIANSLLLQGITPQIIDLITVDPANREKELKKRIPAEPAIYGFSLMIGNHHLDETERHVRIILESSPESIIVYGGSLPSSVPELLLENGCLCHYIVHGEGEITFFELINLLRSGQEIPENFSGVFYRKNGEIRGTRNRRMRKLDRLSNPNFTLFDVEFYANYFKETELSWEIMASRGCRAHCTFCYKFMGDGMSVRSVEDVMDEIEYIMNNHNIKRFYFVDENFLQMKKYFLKFIEEKQRRNLVFDMYAQSRIDEIDEERCRVGSENGLRVISTGVESVSESVLEHINKNISLSVAEEAIARANRYGIRVHVNLILGFPGDSEKSCQDMIDFVNKNQLYGRVKLHYLTPLPSTELYLEVKQNGFIDNDFEYVRKLNNLYWERVVNMTQMSDEVLDHYYGIISEMGKQTRKGLTSEKYSNQVNAWNMYKVVN
ncbi:MAG: B12-binding domain-containing radical SAM protein [Magnetococcales bacterium]|nr:B12-binding domain-containing radical SAM protein [Magnetococcales bacterium]